MPHESPSTANYLAVINDLRAQRDELDIAIALLVREMGKQARTDANGQLPAPLPQVREHVQIEEVRTASGSNGIGEACARSLRNAHPQTLSTREVYERLAADGFEFTTTNPVNNVWNALNNRSKSKRDVENAGGGRWRYVGLNKGASAGDARLSHGAPVAQQ